MARPKSELSTFQETVREIFVVVLGLLIAFALNAWWDGVKKSREEHQILLGLKEDFQESKSRLDLIVKGHERTASALQALLGAAKRSFSPLQDDSLRTLLSRALSIRTYDPQTGTVDALLASGQLSLISDRELRKALSSWPADLEDYKEDERWTREWSHREVRPGLGRLTPLHWTERHTNGEFKIEQRKLLKDIQSLNLLSHQLILTGGVLKGAQQLHQRIDTIVEFIERALAE